MDEWIKLVDMQPDYGVPLIVCKTDGTMRFPVYRLIDAETGKEQYIAIEEDFCSYVGDIAAWMYMPMPFNG